MAAEDNTLFPSEPRPEQIKRYQKIYQTLRNYAKGKVSMDVVLAIPHEEIIATRRWVNEVSVALLEAELPEFKAFKDDPNY